MERQNNSNEALTLDRVNRAMQVAGLADIDLAGLDWLKRFHKQTQLRSALAKAEENEQAREFLRKVYAQIPAPRAFIPVEKTSHEVPQGFHIYGGESALYAYPDVSRNGTRTIAFDGARRKTNGGGAYDWGSKITVQLTGKEIVSLLGWMERREGEIEFKLHGVDQSKGLRLKHQPGGAYARLIQRGRAAVGVALQWEDLVLLHAMTLEQLTRRYPELSEDALRKLVLMHQPGPAASISAESAR